MANSFAVQFQRNIVDEPLPANKSQAYQPTHRISPGEYPSVTPKRR
jgi:hypothetical protein